MCIDFTVERILVDLTGKLRTMDTVTTVLVAHSLYTFLVLQLGELDKDLNFPWYVTLDRPTGQYSLCRFAGRLR